MEQMLIIIVNWMNWRERMTWHDIELSRGRFEDDDDDDDKDLSDGKIIKKQIYKLFFEIFEFLRYIN